MSKHTPGPWAITNDVEEEGFADIETESGILYIRAKWGAMWGMPKGKRKKLCDEMIANAHLIAAAPELLKALEEMIGAWNMVCDVNGWERDHIQQQVDACKAVAKAKGKP